MENIKFIIEKSSRIGKLIDNLYEKMPEIEYFFEHFIPSFKLTLDELEVF